MYIGVEGLPAAGKSEILALLGLFFPNQILVLPELVREVVERENLDLFQDRSRLTQALVELLPARQAHVQAALKEGRVVIEESHLGVHAAYSAALGDVQFLSVFHDLEEKILWPNLFVRLEIPVEVSLRRQAARGDPRFFVPKGVLSRMAGWLSAWHARRADRLDVIDADRAPHEVVEALIQRLALSYLPASQPDVLPYLILLGRPASGKSELIRFLQGLPLSERVSAYHLGSLRVVDDFPFLWQKFEEDDLWEEVGRGRLCSRRAGENYAVADPHLWDFLLLRINREITRAPARPGESVIVEFSRGGSGAYRRALQRLDRRVLLHGAILYLHVSHEESRRRNLVRYDRALRSEVLTHSVPEEEMARTYAVDDWFDLAPMESAYLTVQDISVPYVTVLNEPEPKSFSDFARRFRPALEELHRLWRSR